MPPSAAASDGTTSTGSAVGYIAPVCASMRSGAHPTLSATTHGSPAASASLTTRPHVSRASPQRGRFGESIVVDAMRRLKDAIVRDAEKPQERGTAGPDAEVAVESREHPPRLGHPERPAPSRWSALEIRVAVVQDRHVQPACRTNRAKQRDRIPPEDGDHVG